MFRVEVSVMNSASFWEFVKFLAAQLWGKRRLGFFDNIVSFFPRLILFYFPYLTKRTIIVADLPRILF